MIVWEEKKHRLGGNAYVITSLLVYVNKHWALCKQCISSQTKTQKQKKRGTQIPLSGTRNRGRTGTGITAHRILSPACLPIPPSEPLSLRKDDANVRFLFDSANSFHKSLAIKSYFILPRVTVVVQTLYVMVAESKIRPRLTF